VTDRIACSWRALPRSAVLGGCSVAALLPVVAWPSLDTGSGLLVLRGTAVLLAVAVTFAVDDPAADVLAASPTPLRQRVMVRVALAVAVAGAAWTAAAAVVAARDHVPVAGLTLEVLALAMVGIAVALALQTWGGATDPGILTAPVVAGAVLAANLLPSRWALLVAGPGGPEWEQAHRRWAAVLVVAVVAARLATADRASRHVRVHLR
jgi:hypothetical protein